MTISVRLNEEDQKMLEKIKDKINKQYQNIFGSETKTTNSEVIRASIRFYYDELVQ